MKCTKHTVMKCLLRHLILKPLQGSRERHGLGKVCSENLSQLDVAYRIICMAS